MTVKAFEKKIWLASPTMHGDELKYMQEAYETNWMSTVGENINVVESMLTTKLGRGYAAALSSGTAALHMALRLAGVKPGDRVFCSDVTFAASTNPIIYEGGIPVFIDSEYESWNMDPDALRKAFRKYPGTRVVIYVHLYGTPGRIDLVREICDENGAILIEDAAEALGSRYMGREAGSFGHISAISFNGNKIITGSSGGAILSDSSEDIARVKKWSTQSRENVPWYEHEEIGYNYRMSNVIAGVVRGQMPYLQEHIDRKKNIYMRYMENLGDSTVMNPVPEGTAPNYWLSCMLIDEDAAGDCGTGGVSGKVSPKVGEILHRLGEINAEGRHIWKPMHMQPVFREFDFVTKEEGFAVGEDLFRRGLCLPSDIKMSEDDQDAICECIVDCFK